MLLFSIWGFHIRGRSLPAQVIVSVLVLVMVVTVLVRVLFIGGSLGTKATYWVLPPPVTVYIKGPIKGHI